MKKRVLLLIDFQKVFKPEGFWPIPEFHRALYNALKFSKNFEDDEVFVTRFAPPRNIDGPGWKEYYDDCPPEMRDPNNPLYDLDDALALKVQIDASTFGKWKKFRVEADEVYLCGVSTDCCVLSTALAAVDDGRCVFVVKDACAAEDELHHTRALEIMKGYAPNLKIL